MRLNQNRPKWVKQALYFGKWFTHFSELIKVIFKKTDLLFLWFEGRVMDGEVKMGLQKSQYNGYICGFTSKNSLYFT